MWLRLLLLVVLPLAVVAAMFAALWFGIRAGGAIEGAPDAEPARPRPGWCPAITTAAGRPLSTVVARAARRALAMLAVEVRRVVRTGLAVDDVATELAAVRRLGTPSPDDDPALQTGAYQPDPVERAGVPPARPTAEAPHASTAGVNPWFAAQVAARTGGSW